MEIKMEWIHPGGGRQDENENEDGDGCIVMKRCTTQAGPSFAFEPDDLLFALI